MAPGKPTRLNSNDSGSKSPASITGKAELVKEICEEVKRTVQTPEIVKVIVDSVVESVTNLVIERLEKSINFNTEVVEDLRKELGLRDKKIHEMQENIQELEQYQRRNSLRIFGVPEKENENTDSLALEMFKNKLGVNLSTRDICRSHRVGHKKSSGTRPIIVKFTSYRSRAEVFARKRKLKNSGIVLREDLCAARLQLLKKAIQKFDPNSVYTRDGIIVVVINGKKNFVTNSAQLEEL